MKYIFKQRHSKAADENLINEICEKYSLDKTLGRIIFERVGEGEAENFLHPNFKNIHSPALFSDCAKAVKIIKNAVLNKEKICVFGDYDADGVCACAIMFLALREMGADVFSYIPAREEEGYGMNISAVKKIADSGAKLIITVDCGITNCEEVALAKNLEIAVIVTDHHKCPDILPNADAILDAKREGESYPFKELCGAGVAFKIALALLGKKAFDYIDIAAIATVADMVPLTGENRIIVSKGLLKINKIPSVGIKNLVEMCGFNKEICAESIAFGLAPRINAAGRLKNANIAFNLLTSTESDEKVKNYAKELCMLNTKRREIQESIYLQAESKIQSDDMCVILKDESWDLGIIGLAAANIMQKFGRPAILFGEKNGVITGSARSISKIDIYDALCTQRDLYTKFGGHSGAAGLSMKAENFEIFKKNMLEYFKRTYSPEAFIPIKEYDAIVKIKDINADLAQESNLLEPCGLGNEKIKLLVENANVAKKFPIGNGSHSRLVLEQEGQFLDCVAFGVKSDDIPEKCDILLSPVINDYNKKCEGHIDVFSF